MPLQHNHVMDYLIETVPSRTVFVWYIWCKRGREGNVLVKLAVPCDRPLSHLPEGTAVLLRPVLWFAGRTVSHYINQ